MARLWKGAITMVDFTKRRIILKCEAMESEGSTSQEQTLVVSWDRATRVTESGRGLIPAQQAHVGQMVYADCIQDQDGRWLARAIEIVRPAEPGQRSVTQQQERG